MWVFPAARPRGNDGVMDVAPQHDPFDEPDAEDEADTRERALAGGDEAGDGDLPEVRRELGIDDAEEDTGWTSGPAPSMAAGISPGTPDESSASRVEGVPDGFDEHDWESTWASIEEVAQDDPDAALSQYADLVEQILVARGHALDDPVAREGEEPEVVRTYLAARETAERAELGEASRGDVELAIEDLRALFDTISGEIDYS
jgi:hypothetical protein